MDIKDWELLKVLAEVKSMSQAAEKTYLSQPAVLYRINRMEQEMEVTLFQRNNKGIRLTSAGLRLLSFADRMLLQNTQIRTYVRRPDQMVCGEIQISAASTAINNFLPSLMKHFGTRYPDVTFLVNCGLNDEIIHRLNQQEISLAMVRGDFQWEGGVVLIYRESLMIISSKPIDEETLVDDPIIFYHQTGHITTVINEWYRGRYGVSPRMKLHTDHGPMNCLSMVKEGLGWAIVPALHLKKEKTLYRKILKDQNGEPYIHPTRLLYYPYIRDFDIYDALISFAETFFSEERTDRDWVGDPEAAGEK